MDKGAQSCVTHPVELCTCHASQASATCAVCHTFYISLQCLYIAIFWALCTTLVHFADIVTGHHTSCAPCAVHHTPSALCTFICAYRMHLYIFSSHGQDYIIHTKRTHACFHNWVSYYAIQSLYCHYNPSPHYYQYRFISLLYLLKPVIACTSCHFITNCIVVYNITTFASSNNV
jgi:hypothetical protein